MSGRKTSRNPGFSERLVYWVDRVLTSSTRVQFVTLAVFCVLVTLFFAGLAWLAAPSGGLSQALWWTWVRVTDGNYLGGDNGPALRTISTFVLLAGWIVFSLLVSIISTSIQHRLDQLRKGVSHVLASGHSVVLGWDSTVFSVLDQLAARDEEAPTEVVVLADRDKECMEADIAKHCLTPQARRTICRSGRASLRPWPSRQVLAGHHLPADGLTLVAAIDSHEARSLIQPILSDDETSPFVRVVLVEPRDILARVIAQCAAQPSLALVYRDLLSYWSDQPSNSPRPGAEIYLVTARQAGVPAGTRFEDALRAFPAAIPVGYSLPDGPTTLNPLPGTREAGRVLQPDDTLVCVAERWRDVRWATAPEPRPVDFEAPAHRPDPRRVLVLGRGRTARMVSSFLPHYLPAGSHILATETPERKSALRGCRVEPVTFAAARDILEGEVGRAVDLADTVVLLDDETDLDRHDSRTLYYLAAVHARSLAAGRRPSVIVELLDPRNRPVAEATGARQVIISPELVSNYMVQLAREPGRAAVYTDLLDPAGSEVYAKPAHLYARAADETLSFDEIMVRARTAGQIAIGYVAAGGDLVLCPPDRGRARPASAYADIIVIAEE